MSKAVALVVSLSCATALAMGLQIAPNTLDLPVESKAVEMWLVNTSDQPRRAQLRVYQWDQNNKTDTLVPSTSLIVSPPMAKIPPNGKQLIRVMRPKGLKATSPVSMFRILVNELPNPPVAGRGVDFVVEYSVPVFVYHTKPDELLPKLNIGLEVKGAEAHLWAKNQGDLYGKLYSLAFIDRQGKRTVLNSGLVGYVLPQREMAWPLKQPPSFFVQGGTLELRVNGKTYSEAVAPLRQ